MQHLVIRLNACPHEAFEALLEEGSPTHGAREDTISIDDLCASSFAPLSPFPTVIETVECPRFAADNPEVLQRVLQEAYDAAARHL